jgi:hypothetical protein
MSKTMEITYSLTEADIVSLNMFRAHHDSSLHKRIGRARLRLIISFVVVGIGLWLITNIYFFLIWFIALSVLSFFFYYHYYEWRVKKRVGDTYKNPNYKSTLDTHTLVASSDGLMEISSLGQMKIDWDNVDGFFDTPTHVFISVGQIASIPIPKKPSAFSTGNLDLFISTCQTFKKQFILI